MTVLGGDEGLAGGVGDGGGECWSTLMSIPSQSFVSKLHVFLIENKEAAQTGRSGGMGVVEREVGISQVSDWK